MNKNILLVAAFSCFAAFGFAQIKVVAPNGDTGIGTSTPVSKLDVVGDLTVSKVANDLSPFQIVNFNASQVQLNKSANGTNSLIDINPKSLDGTSNAKFRFFRETNTSGSVKFEVHYGDGSSGVNISFAGNGNSFINRDFGNVGIGTGAPTHKLTVDGDASKPGGGSWATFSDKRLKKNIRKYSRGLNEILEINPVTFQYNGKASISDTESRYVGIIAQEIQEVLPETVSEVLTYEDEFIGDEFTGKSVRKNEETYLSYDGSELIYTLINAVKEQQGQIENLKSQLDQLASSNSYSPQTQVVLSGDNENATIKQNNPNPYSESTVIEYILPQNTTSAVVLFNGLDGKLIKTIDLDTTITQGQLNISMEQIQSGTYTYSLIVDGELVDTKKMSFVK